MLRMLSLTLSETSSWTSRGTETVWCMVGSNFATYGCSMACGTCRSGTEEVLLIAFGAVILVISVRFRGEIQTLDNCLGLLLSMSSWTNDNFLFATQMTSPPVLRTSETTQKNRRWDTSFQITTLCLESPGFPGTHLFARPSLNGNMIHTQPV